MRPGDFLIAKSAFKVPTWNKNTKEQLDTLEIKEYEKCEIVKIHLSPEYVLEVKCGNNIIGFSLIDLDFQAFDFYQHYFYDYRLSIQDIRKIKLKKLNIYEN